MTFTATPSPYRLAPAWIGGAIGVFLAFLVLVAPDWRLETLVGQLGLPDILSAAQPPLGTKARLILAVAAGIGAGAVGWAIAYLLWGPGGLLAKRVPVEREDDDDYVPSVRRSDRHPDAPPRRPLHAAELGAPPPPAVEEDDIVERTLPADLDQPLAAFDPDAILSAPRSPVRPVAPLTPEPMPLPPMREPAPVEQGAALPLPDRANESIETLLDRLERETALRKSKRVD
ncbi:hypothetical protein [Sphingomonas sanguinis]|jgi:hypothetical protein|uniref:Uncharacterized protein n=1 Tax=Sphingomonas sanguinis TaxID=33051 RepID=A0A7Y7QSQ0_9SPHN|nr:hypothetical protein [Sphingomonas sanguinis]MBZ6380678.1 hypothetical protein [Sphingomonas sanguinis]NNG49511.1 hypothetical protein [Sphingomonas sanguinis]NNG53311.1 hypothetical protein [Sphingomonas sanguinis]NVP29980.1 hypothetical protein [Sphingomonas sanguinis]